MLLSSFGCLNNNRGRTDNLPPGMALVNCFLLAHNHDGSLILGTIATVNMKPGHMVVTMLKAMPEGHV